MEIEKSEESEYNSTKREIDDENENQTNESITTEGNDDDVLSKKRKNSNSKAQNQMTKRKSLRTKNNKNTDFLRKNVKFPINSKTKITKNEKNDYEDESFSEEDSNKTENDLKVKKKPFIKIKALEKAKIKNSKVTPRSPKCKFKYEEDTDGTDVESISSNSNKKPNKKRSSQKSAVNLTVEPVFTGRPKREAGMRASAMIIQTNEIEKTRFQYYSSATSLSNSHPFQTANLISTSKKKKPINPNQIDTNQSLTVQPQSGNKKTKSSDSLSKSQANFQIPQPVSLYASLNAGNGKSSNSTNKITKARQTAGHNITSTSFTSSQVNQTSVGFNTRHISASLTNNAQNGNNCGGGDDSSSNDVLIVMETSSPQKANQKNSQLINSSKTSTERSLTEDILAEHNKLNGTLGCGSGGFNNYTREYISKWAQEYKPNDEKPFPPGSIPIESFGVKILNEPQYLQNKSRFGGNSTSNQVTIAPVPIVTSTAIVNNPQTLKTRTANNTASNSNSPNQTKAVNTNNETNSIETKGVALNEQVTSKNISSNNQATTTLTNNNPNQASHKTYSNNSNNSNDKLNSVNKKLNLASSKGINNISDNNQLSNKNSANITNILNENSNNGINSSNNINDTCSNNNNSTDNNLNYFPSNFISA